MVAPSRKPWILLTTVAVGLSLALLWAALVIQHRTKTRLEDQLVATGRNVTQLARQRTELDDALVTEREATARETTLRRTAEDVNARVTETLAATRRDLYRTRLFASRLALSSRDIAAAREQLEAAPQEFRNWEWGHLGVQTHDVLRSLTGHTDSLYSLAASRDGTWVVTTSIDDTIRVWHTGAGETIARFDEVGDFAPAVAIHPDGGSFATGWDDGTITLWDVGGARELAVLDSHDPGLETGISALRYTPDGTRLLAGAEDGAVVIWDVDGRTMLRILRGHEGDVNDLAGAAERPWIASAGDDRTVRVWNLEDGTAVATLHGHDDWVRTVALTGDGATIASGSYDRTAIVWNLDTEEPRLRMKLPEAVLSVTLSPAGGRLRTTTGAGSVHEWETTTGQELRSWRAAVGPVQFVAAGGSTVAFGGTSPELHLWNLGETTSARHIVTGGKAIQDLSVAADGRRLAAACVDGTIRVLDVATGQETSVLRGHPKRALCVAFSPAGDRILSGGLDGTVLVHDPDRPEAIRVHEDHDTPVVSLGVSEDGTITTVSIDAHIRRYSLDTGELLSHKPGPRNGVLAVATSADGAEVFWGADGGNLRIWDAATGKKIAGIRHPDLGMVSRLALSPGGRLLTTASPYGAIRVWDTGTGKLHAECREFAGFVGALIFSPDGRRIVTGSNQGLIQIWDADTGEELAPLRGSLGSVQALAFDADGKRLFAGGSEGGVEIRDSESAGPAETKRRSGR